MNRPYTPPGIGWILALIALILGILVIVGSIELTKGIVGGEFILLSLAILL